jgi:hypothetical protein
MLAFLRGLDLWVQIYCAVIFVLFSIFIALAWWSARNVRSSAESLRALLHKAKMPVAERRTGRPLELVERIRTDAAKLPNAPASWWGRLDAALSPYGAGESRARGWFLTAPAGEILDEDVVIHRHYDGGFYGSVPGLLTSLGLLGTFIAILVGLRGLQPEGDIIRGVPGLVGSLSGKFTTSVVALGLSAFFTLIESLAFQARMRRARERLLGAVHDSLPALSTSQVLLDVYSENAKQSRSLANISSDVVDRFAAVFRNDLAPQFAAGLSAGVATELTQGLGPAIGSMIETMKQVGEAVQRLESTKQESVVGEIKGLTTSLEQSLRTALAEMGERFREALTGSAHNELDGVSRMLNDSASVLGQMNSSFSAMQTSLTQLIEESRRTTSNQMTAGAQHAEQLSQLVEGLLVRLNESAASNASHVNNVLTQVVSDLSERVTKLSSELTSQVAAATAQTQEAAAESLRVAGDWSARSDRRLIEVLTALEAKVADFDKASLALVQAQRVLESTLGQSTAGLRAMQEAAGEVRAYSTSLAGLQAKITDAQNAHTRVATTTQTSIEQLKEMSERHDGLLARYDTTFVHAERVFQGLDERLRRVLETILEKVQQYNVGVERNFNAIVTHVNTTMPQMGEVLAGAAVELREQVEELTEVLETGVARIRR